MRLFRLHPGSLPADLKTVWNSSKHCQSGKHGACQRGGERRKRERGRERESRGGQGERSGGEGMGG